MEYKYEEIFQDIDGDPDNVLMTIPPEICNALGITEGDTIEILVQEGRLEIKKKVDTEGS